MGLRNDNNAILILSGGETLFQRVLSLAFTSSHHISSVQLEKSTKEIILSNGTCLYFENTFTDKESIIARIKKHKFGSWVIDCNVLLPDWSGICDSRLKTKGKDGKPLKCQRVISFSDGTLIDIGPPEAEGSSGEQEVHETDTDLLLRERSKIHGDFDSFSVLNRELKRTFRMGPAWPLMSDFQREGLEQIAGKICRALNGNPNYIDHWTDIIGYASLVKKQIEKDKAGG